MRSTVRVATQKCPLSFFFLPRSTSSLSVQVTRCFLFSRAAERCSEIQGSEEAAYVSVRLTTLVVAARKSQAAHVVGTQERIRIAKEKNEKCRQKSEVPLWPPVCQVKQGFDLPAHFFRLYAGVGLPEAGTCIRGLRLRPGGEVRASVLSTPSKG